MAGFKKKDLTAEIQNKSFDLKYRAEEFDKYLGNDIIKQDIKLKLKSGNMPHFIIFWGGSGCGKTTMGRLLTRELMCQNKTPEGLACGVCPICKEVTEKYIKLGKTVGRGIIEEPNLSADTGKEFIVNMIESAVQKPLPPYKVKVRLLDEAHKASKASQNAMLKSLEEAPDHLYYIMCTTEPNLLLDTIRGRAVEYHVKKPTLKQLTDKLEWICQQENMQYDIKALEMIARKNNLVPRNSIKALDSLKDHEVISQQVVSTFLDIISNEVYLDFFKLLKKDIVEIFLALDKMLDSGIDLGDFADGLLRFVMDSINMKYGVHVDSYSQKMYTEVRQIFKGYTYDDMVMLLHTINKFATRSFSSANKAEAGFKELAIELSRPLFFNRTLVKEERVAEIENNRANVKYQKVQDQRLNDVKVDTSEITDANDLVAMFGGSHVVDTDLPDEPDEATKQLQDLFGTSENNVESDIQKYFDDNDPLAKSNIDLASELYGDKVDTGTVTNSDCEDE